MKKVIRRMKSSNKTKNIGKISASEFDGKANYDFHQIRKNSEDEKQEEQRCDIATEDTMSCVLSFNTSESNNDSARDDDVSTTEMKNEPLQPSKRNIEIDKEITSNQHTFFLSKLEKVRNFKVFIPFFFVFLRKRYESWNQAILTCLLSFTAVLYVAPKGEHREITGRNESTMCRNIGPNGQYFSFSIS